MDRRQKKTRAAIFAAFSSLLAKQDYSSITVQQIIDTADIGRTTFYDHFSTKDDLLNALCGELFSHIVDSALTSHMHDGAQPSSIFCHLLQHLERNDNNILALISSGNGAFLFYFRESLKSLVKDQYLEGKKEWRKLGIPEDFIVNHIAGSFVEMVLWWTRGGLTVPPPELDSYFRKLIEPGL